MQMVTGEKPMGLFALVPLLLLVGGGVEGCSHFFMNFSDSSFQLSARTMDLGGALDWIVHGFPPGHSRVLGKAWTAKYGFVGFTPRTTQALNRTIPLDGLDLGLFSARDVVADGLNQRGLSCGFLTLDGSQFERPSLLPGRDLLSLSLCKYVLENFGSVAEVEQALPQQKVIFNADIHFAIADAQRELLVVEFLQGQMRMHRDANSNSAAGYGIMTNEPPFEWQLTNVQHLQWKMQLARPSVAIPGNFYPDERFLRIHLIKQAIETSEQPSNYRQAVARTVAVLNSVNVPMGEMPGTDSGTNSGEGDGDHTQWAVVRDHKQLKYYLRSESNPSLRLIDLTKLDLRPGAKLTTMLIEDDPWFLDVSSKLSA